MEENKNTVNRNDINRRPPTRRRINNRATNGIKAAVFFLTLIGFMLFSFMLPLRPTESAVEKRELAKYPDFSLSALASGEYFSDIDTWFSDTFPAKETFVSINGWIKSLYGFGNEVHGTITKGDDIPEVPKTN